MLLSSKSLSTLSQSAAKSNLTNNIFWFSNGWQSWSYSAAYRSCQRMRTSRLDFLQQPMVVNSGTPIHQRKGRFSSDFFGVLADNTTRTGLLFGLLSQKQHFGTIYISLQDELGIQIWANGDKARLDPGNSMLTDWAVIQIVDFSRKDPLDSYLDAVVKEHQISSIPQALSGWCSWYYYYQNISGSIIRKNIDQIYLKHERIPLELIQIDDGYQSRVGDWLTFNSRFPDGVKNLAQEIRTKGFTPGIWLAPFILHPGSKTAQKHPDWLLRDEKRRLVRTGFVWNSLGVTLDLTIEDALKYACHVVDCAVHQWGFSYLKLDFLYAAALKGLYHDNRYTRAQVLRKGMEAIRKSAGYNTFLLGCGAPLGAVIGLVDAMRIGADVSSSWKPKFSKLSFPFEKEPHMPSARNSIQNILTRAPFHNKWWVNDPDCLVLGSDLDLTIHEIQSLASAISLTGGSVLLSDDMTRLSVERIQLAASLLPPISQRAWVVNWIEENTPKKLRLDFEGLIGEWSLLAYFNWTDKDRYTVLTPADYYLGEVDFFVRSFWESTCWIHTQGTPIFSGKISPHGVVVLAVRKRSGQNHVYLGSSLHISQEMEVKAWNKNKDIIKMILSQGKKLDGVVDLFLSHTPKRITLNNEIWDCMEIFKGIFQIPIRSENIAEILIYS